MLCRLLPNKLLVFHIVLLSVTLFYLRFKGIREGGVSDNVSWYVFLQAKDGAFEAFPVEEWYNFQPINRYKALNAEEAEAEFEK